MQEKTDRRFKEVKALVSEDLSSWLEGFYRKLLYEKRASLHTTHAYLSDLKYFFIFIKEYKGHPLNLENFKTLTLTDLRAFLASRLQSNTTKRTNARFLSSIKAFGRYLRLQGQHVSPAFEAITAPRLDKKLPRPLSKNQCLTLTNLKTQTWVELRNQALFTLLYGCGLRISEALNLNGSDWTESVLLIKGKGRKERRVPLLKPVFNKVEHYLKASPYSLSLDMPLFRGVKGGRMSSSVAEKAIRNLRLDLGLPETATPHALRHSFATHLLENGGELRHIQELLGHASLSSTQIYTDLTHEKLYDSYQEAHPKAKNPSTT